MKIIEKHVLQDGTKIQLENWFGEVLTIGAYPISRKTDKKFYGRVAGKTFRISLEFNNVFNCKLAFKQLIANKKTLKNFSEVFHNLEDVEYL